MKALILNTGSELKKLLMKKKYLVLTVLGADYMYSPNWR